MPYLLDTCAILFIAEKTTDLSADALGLIDAAPAGEVFVSAVSVAELACLQEGRRITLKRLAARNRFAGDDGVTVPPHRRKSAICNTKPEIKRNVVLDIFAGSNTTGCAAAESICDLQSAI